MIRLRLGTQTECETRKSDSKTNYKLDSDTD
jgi:hypothetical protein